MTHDPDHYLTQPMDNQEAALGREIDALRQRMAPTAENIAARVGFAHSPMARPSAWSLAEHPMMSHMHSGDAAPSAPCAPEEQQTPDSAAAVHVGSGAWLAVSFGGGTNSTAMLCGMRERGIRPDFIAFADTGAEYPHTYEHVAMMAAQVKAWWNVELLTVRKTYQGGFEGLEGECNRHQKMPSISYGRRSCSVKYKHEPQTRALKAAMKAAGITHATKAIGFDAGEGHRVKEEHLAVQALNKTQTVQNWYPLVEWGWARAECVAAIERHGLPQPGKSSCFFCGAMKKREVYALRDQYPELLARALKIEDDAQKTNRTNRGLGGERNLWRDWLNQDAAQAKLWDDVEPVHVPCGCYDGTGCDVPANSKQ